MKRQIVLITGASGSGKTTVLKTLEKMLPAEQIATYYFDSLGVPSLEEMIAEYGSPEQWQKATTEIWIEKLALINEPKLLILEGSFNPEFAVNALQNLGLTDYHLFCLHAERDVREHRLIHDRQQPELANQDMENFAQFLRRKTLELGGHIIKSPAIDSGFSAQQILNIVWAEN